MTKLEYYLLAIRANCYLRKDWVISVFAITELPAAIKAPQYDYQLLNFDGYYGFIDPTDNTAMVFEDVPVNEEFLTPDIVFTAPTLSLPNIITDTRTTVGNLLFNAIVLAYPFNNKMSYINKSASIKEIESLIVGRLVDDPPPTAYIGNPTDVELGTIDSTSPLYIKEYKKFAEAATSLAGYAQIFVPAATPRTLVPAPGYQELKAKLLKQYGNQLNDATVIAEIEKQLYDLDRDWIQNDPDFGFVRTVKAMKVARKRMFYVHGIEAGFSEDGKFTFIPNSLNDGWDISKLPAMVNSLRDGSFNRGAQTALGGEKTKTIFRVMAGATIESEDCGAKIGIRRIAQKNTWKVYHGSTAILDDGTQLLITETSLQPYLGQLIQIRSPLFCLAGHNNFCMTCLGQFMRGNENSLGVVAAACGSTLLLSFMKAMHGKILSTVNYDIYKELV
jgi:hypothetical protein